jgi:hypothetical protein
MTETAELTPDQLLAEEAHAFYDDPYGFVLWAYPWGEPGTILEKETGPDEWQETLLRQLGEDVRKRGFNGVDPVTPIRHAVVSGHGSGKSALASWLRDWLMSTRPNCRGTITASTSPQLETKTWPEMSKWTKLCVTGHWFEITMGRGSMKMVHKDNPDGWKCTAQTSREENSESFAGQHEASSTSWYIFDEGSAIPTPIYEVAEGGMTDGEPMIFVFGNGTRNTGRFHEMFHGKIRHRWRLHHVDARKAKKPNKETHQQWIDDYGLDSDFVRVRVLGQFPKLGAMQWIASDVVEAARVREVVEDRMQRMVISVDCARGGGAMSVIARRRGLDARSWPWYRLNTRDTMTLVGKIVEVFNEHMALGDEPVVFIDSTGLGGPIYDRLLQMGIYCIPVNFAAGSPDKEYSNLRTCIWGRMRDWLVRGAIPDEQTLADDLTNIEYGFDKQNRFLLESKDSLEARGIASPDDGDALAIGFAVPMPPRDWAAHQARGTGAKRDYDPMA